jgi:threonine/homoserine/homoserine lactone efflux protein
MGTPILSTMTIPEALLGFALVVGLLTIIPGLDTALVLRTALTRSRGRAYATASGVQAGTVVWAVAAAVGATALLAASAVAFELVKVAGAAYLVVMGVLLIRATLRHAPGADELPQPSGGPWRGFGTGLVSNLLNPKVGVFYLATIPQFVPEGLSPLTAGFMLAGVHVVLGMTWFTGIIFGAAAVGGRLRSARFVRWVDRITGGVLVLLGGRLASEARL